MRRITAIFLLATFLVSSSAALAQKQSADPIKNPKRAHEGWKLVWADEFNGKKLDTDSWERCPRNTADWGRHMSYLDTLVQVEDGVLKLYGINRPDEVKDNVPYLTGGVQSRNRRSLQLGRVDVRARFDCGQGFWPAIWLMPDIRVPWATGGEIDIMEHVGYHPNYVSSSIHCQAYYHSIGTQKTHELFLKTAQTEFHTYACEWTEDYINFYFDGELHFTFNNDHTNNYDTWPFYNPFYLKLNLAWGGNWGGAMGLDESCLPATYEIDYVRVFKK